MRKRIALDALMLDSTKAGVGNYQLNLIENLKGMPFYFDVFTSEDSPLESEGAVNVIKLKKFSSSKDRLLFQLFGFADILNKGNYNLVHFLDYMTPVKKLNTPHITTVHDISFRVSPQYFTKKTALFKQANLPRALKKSAGIITVSEFTKSEILKEYPKTDKSKIDAVNLGINSPSEKIEQFDIKKPYILFVGTVEPRKNILMLIKAMESVWEKGFEPNLVIAGKFGWLYEETVSYAKNSRFAEKIIFTDYVSDGELEYLYKNAELFAYPSLYEGFGLPPLEAMRRGKVVISTPFASLPEVLEDAAYYAENQDEFAESIIKIISDDNLKKEYESRALCHADKKTWLKTAENTCMVYEKRSK